MQWLQMTRTPETQQCLREIVQETSDDPNRTKLFGSALATLFYVYQDSSFVNQRLVSFLEGDHRGAAVDAELMWRLAS